MFSVILFIEQLWRFGHVLLQLTVNLTTEASRWLKKKVASKCHHHMVAEPLIADMMARICASERSRIAVDSCRGDSRVGSGKLARVL